MGGKDQSGEVCLYYKTIRKFRIVHIRHTYEGVVHHKATTAFVGHSQTL